MGSAAENEKIEKVTSSQDDESPEGSTRNTLSKLAFMRTKVVLTQAPVGRRNATPWFAIF
jgi:hypothetical protein